MKTLNIFWIFILCIITSIQKVNAHWEPSISGRADITNSTFTINNNPAFNPSSGLISAENWLYSRLSTENTLREVVDHPHILTTYTLGINQGNTYRHDEYCEIEVKLQVKNYNIDGSFSTSTIEYSDSLKIKFDPLSGLQDFTGITLDVGEYLKTEFYILEVNYRTLNAGSLSNLYITSNGHSGFGDLPEDLFVEAKVEVDRIYNFTSNQFYNKMTDNGTQLDYVPVDQPVFYNNVLFNTPYDPCSGYIELSWPSIITSGFDNYELEWTFVEDELATSTGTNTFDIDFDFINNSTRVQVKGNSYLIPAIYPKGYLIARVRGVTEDFYYTNTTMYKTPWSLSDQGTISYNNSSGTFTNSGIIRYAVYISGFSEDFNWETSTSFAEEGKRKQVISYYDGTLRNRQTVTTLSTEKIPVVGEVIYDYLGRPAIQPLPVPTLDGDGLCFRGQFNLSNSSNLPYNWKDFDIDDPTCGEGKTGSMSINNGAAWYYSGYGGFYVGQAGTAFNVSSNQKNNAAFLPNSEGYPFTQVEYMPDGTGRIRRQGGIGKMHQLNGSDENGQALPGKEVKYYYSYATDNELIRLFGNEVGFEVRYKKNYVIDQNGQTSVSYIDPDGRIVATSLVGDPNAVINLGPLASGSGDNFYLTDDIKNTTVDFQNGELTAVFEHYVSLAGNFEFNYSMTSPQLSGLCDNGLCFDCIYDFELSIVDECGVELIPGGPKQNTVGTVDYDCGTESISFTMAPDPLVLYLNVGNIRVVKKLKINEEAYKLYEAKYIEEIDNCIPTFNEIYTEERSKLIDDCEYDICSDCIGNAASDLANGYISQLEYDFAVLHCKEICNPTPCTILLRNMLQDMSPGGQYFDNYESYDPGTMNPDDQTPSYAWLDQELSTQNKTDFFTAINSAFNTNFTDWDEVRNYWRDEYAFLLIQYHPELCLYNSCKSIESTYEFDKDMLSSTDGLNALQNGYFNPIGSNTNYTSFPAPTTKDPLFVNSQGNPIRLYYEMREGLNLWNSGQNCTPIPCPTIWDFLNDMWNYSPTSSVSGSINCPSQYDFKMFYAAYQTVKHPLIERYYDSVCFNPSNPEVDLNIVKERRFIYKTQDLDLTTGILDNPPVPNDVKANTRALMLDGCGEKCEGYATSWADALAPCNLTQTHLDMLIAELTEICKNSCDEENAFGSNGSNIPTINNNRTFEDALNWIIAFDPNYSLSEGCNPEVISFPNKVLSQTNSMLSKPLDDCACDKIAETSTEYATKLATGTLPAGICSESDYFTYLHGFSINLDVVKCQCAYLDDPNYTSSACTDYFEEFEERNCDKQKRQKMKELDYLFTKVIADYGTDWYGTSSSIDLLNYSSLFNEGWLIFDRTDPSCSSFTYTSSIISGQLVITLHRPCGTDCYIYIDILDPDYTYLDIDKLIFDNYQEVGPNILIKADVGASTYVDVQLTLTCFNCTSTERQFPATYIPSSFGCISCIDCDDISGYWTSFSNKYSGLSFDKSEWKHVAMFKTYLTNNEELNLNIDDLYALLNNCANQGLCDPTPISHNLVSLFQALINSGDYSNSTTYLDNANYGQVFADLFEHGFTDCNPRVIRNSATSYSLLNDCGFNCTINLTAALSGSMVLEVNSAYSDPLLSGKLKVAIDANHSTFIEFTSTCYTFASCSGEPTLEICSPVEATPIDPCVKMNDELATANANRRYKRLRQDAIDDLRKRYYEKCMEAFEEFGVKHNLKEYHYTLYYYDQAGNLVKTVPPAGVNPISDPNQIAQAKSYRLTQTGNRIIPSHSLITRYTYNTINQLIEQETPDGGKSRFWYDYLGRLVISQNAKQNQDYLYSYTEFDALGRVTESGEITLQNGISPSESADPVYLATLLDNQKTTKTQIVKTFYDEPFLSYGSIPNLKQFNLINRVSSSLKQDVYTSDPFEYSHATHYTYDIHGNVSQMVTDRPSLETFDSRYKNIEYKYDLISGNTQLVMYQPGEIDQWYHYYRYDADNRITELHTTSNFDPELLRGFTLPNLSESAYWENDAGYEYYLHGPLMRMTYGEPVVQGLDYAYTIHGWLKTMNASALSPERDMGRDGHSSGLNQGIPIDAFAMELHYYNGDYLLVNGQSRLNPIANQNAQSHLVQNTYDLYNGNISQMHVSIPDPTLLGQGNFMNATLGKTYYYDQLNRILSSLNHDDFNLSSFEWGVSAGNVSDQYKTTYTYDANGNILSLYRNGVNGKLPMDDLIYHYIPNTNQLEYVTEQQGNDFNYPDDIENQDPNNYQYDEIGNLTVDQSEEIESIEWNVMGKISKIIRTTNSEKSDLEFKYNEFGNRIEKIEYLKAVDERIITRTFYSLDPSGDPITIYLLHTWLEQGVYYDSLYQGEKLIYGSKRVGLEKMNRNLAFRQYEIVDEDVVNESITIHSLLDPINYSATETKYALENLRSYRGKKQYEISNHLGNVSAVVTDKKIAIPVNGSPNQVDYYEPDIYMLYDYYPFGSLMPQRFYINNGCARVAQPPIVIELENEQFDNKVSDPTLIGTWMSSDPLAIHTSFNQSCQCFEINTYNNLANYVSTIITPAYNTKNAVNIVFDPVTVTKVTFQIVDPNTGKVWANKIFSNLSNGHIVAAELEYTPDMSASSPLELRITAVGSGNSEMIIKEINWYDLGGTSFNNLMNEAYTLTTNAWTSSLGVTINNGPGMDVVNITSTGSGSAWNPITVTPNTLNRIQFDMTLFVEPQAEIEIIDPANLQVLYKEIVENTGAPGYHLDASFTPMGSNVDFRINVIAATQPSGIDIDNFILETPFNSKASLYFEDFSSLTTGTWTPSSGGVVLTYDPGSGSMKVQTSNDYEFTQEDVSGATSGGQEYYLSMEVYTDLNNITQLDVIDVATLRPISSRIIPVTNGHYLLTLSFNSQSGVYINAARANALGIATFRIDNIEVSDYQHFPSSSGGLSLNATTDYFEWTATGGLADFKTYLDNNYKMEVENYNASYVSRFFSVVDNEVTDLSFTLDRRGNVSGNVAVVVINPANNGTLASQIISAAGLSNISFNFIPPGTSIELRLYNPGDYTLIDDLILTYDKIVYHTVCDNTSDYRYGFNGQEKDNEKDGLGNTQTFKYRINDARLGRFLSVDPLYKDYPHQSTYAFCENRVIDKMELEGAEATEALFMLDLYWMWYDLVNSGSYIQHGLKNTNQAANRTGNYIGRGIPKPTENILRMGQYNYGMQYYEAGVSARVNATTAVAQFVPYVDLVVDGGYIIHDLSNGDYTGAGLALSGLFLPGNIRSLSPRRSSMGWLRNSSHAGLDMYSDQARRARNSTFTGRKVKFTANNYRKNLIKATGFNGIGYDAHHKFPKANEFQLYWQKFGMNIHDPANMTWWLSTPHRRNSGAYNDAWRNFFQNKNITKKDVYSFADELEKEFAGCGIYSPRRVQEIRSKYR